MDERTHSAWLPLTPRGVAAFARASLGRLLLVEFIFALIAAAVVIWFLQETWCPSVRQAIRRLPVEGTIRRGHLTWRGDSPANLAGNQFLNLTVDLWHEGGVGNESHLSLEFGRSDIRVRSLLG